MGGVVQKHSPHAEDLTTSTYKSPLFEMESAVMFAVCGDRVGQLGYVFDLT